MLERVVRLFFRIVVSSCLVANDLEETILSNYGMCATNGEQSQEESEPETHLYLIAIVP